VPAADVAALSLSSIQLSHSRYSLRYRHCELLFDAAKKVP
jgi:hypothetical protein